MLMNDTDRNLLHVKQSAENPLFRLFKAKDRSEFKKLANEVTLSSKDLNSIIHFSALKTSSLRHMFGHRSSNPIKLTEKDWEKIRRTHKSKKLLSAIMQSKRSMFFAFWLDLGGDEGPWWLIWYDLQDRQVYGNHWKATGSPHAHMISHLTHPRECLNKYTKALANDPNYKLPHSVHIRFEDDGWQDIVWG
ncbi:hypothetical protein [Paracoccus beibuensis]|uniref:hypothetical protein n=1 Tax=Paracoccus beibuensis TaxID=547602 RepID=UPI00223FED7A|nr:hypothetical protein [Paracoccus beibuensis]